MGMTFNESLEWAADNGIDIEIIRKGSTTAVTASRGRVSTNYIIDLGEPHGFKGAVWACLNSLRTGIEYHAVHGFTPGLDPGQGPVGERRG